LQGALADAQIILCTATASADPSVANLPPFDLAILDEAGQATAPNGWLPLLRARRGLLVGDAKQLPPTLLSPAAAAGGLDLSLLEAFETRAPTGACVGLQTQYRMHADICDWASAAMYGGQLSAAAAAAARTLDQLEGVEKTEITSTPLLVLDTPASGGGNERRRADGALSNPAEARAVLTHVRALMRAGVPGTGIAVLSPYAAQAHLIRAALNAAAEAAAFDSELAAAAAAAGGYSAVGATPALGEVAGGDSGAGATPWLTLGQVEVSTVDGFQGREAEAVVISLVRSNPKGAIGFLGDQRRLNVAATRARRHLAIVCDSATLRRTPFLGGLLEHCAARGVWKGGGGAGEVGARQEGGRQKGQAPRDAPPVAGAAARRWWS
jgi:superfamily I DNA and/or RNA helicase